MPALDDLIAEWEREDPGSTDIETPPAAPMELPEMDLTEDELPPLPPPPREQAPMGLPPAPEAEHSPRSPSPSVAGSIVRKNVPSTPATEGPDWKGLAQRLGLAEIGRGQSRAYESLFSNVGAQSGYRPNAHAGDAAVAVAKQPLELATEKQGMELRDLDMKSRTASLGAKAAMDDPNSMQSQKSRDMLAAAMGGTLPPGAQNWTANDVQRFVQTGAVARSAADRRQAATDAAKAQAGAEKAASEGEALSNSQKAFTNELKDLGIDPTKASQKDIDRAISLRHAKANEAIAASSRRDKDDDRAALGDSIPFAGGALAYRGGGKPREDDRKEVQKVASLYGSAINGMDDLGRALDEFARNPSPETKDNVAAKAHVVGGHLNTASGQGAMSKDEAQAMSAALGTDILSPTGFQAFVQKFIGNDAKAAATLTRKLRAVRETARTSALGKVKAYNYDLGSGSGAGGGGSPGKVKVSNGKESFLIDAADVADAERDGFKAVR
jgi:hypothetical protein